ncbi:hypothetical protein [Mesorhizobium sp. LNJC405B00]|uniref:hypothetical protein n=1 Tax=unclassified Mesorhizobium TaxID=325217 RepID=UPI0003CED711|nr:hypothetical protein [Mesorhizobium sp. LNJC405B00]ESX96005.1 hypothetical protein X755_20990 [Mesorhizobium sp. LNJC405B00]
MTTIHQPEMRREDGAIFLTVAENDRLAIATSIERLIDLLDAMSPDPDLEESLGWGYGSQLELHAQDGEREEENEHGGDINDERHDALDEGDSEPFLGWREQCCQSGVGTEEWNGSDDQGGVSGPCDGFRGDGVLAGRTVLRELQRRRPDVKQRHVPSIPAYGTRALVVNGLNITGAPSAKASAVRVVPGKVNVEDHDWIVEACPQIDPAHWRAYLTAKGF